MWYHQLRSQRTCAWPIDTNYFDLQKDKNHIIHKIFAYGNIHQWRWLFKNYPLQTLNDVFINYPEKIYRPEAFNYVKNILLDLKNKNLARENYIKYSARITFTKSSLIFNRLDAAKRKLQLS